MSANVIDCFTKVNGELVRRTQHTMCPFKTGTTNAECNLNKIHCTYGPSYPHFPVNCPLSNGSVELMFVSISGK